MARRLPGRKLKKVHIKVFQKEYTFDLRIEDVTDSYSRKTELRYLIVAEEPCRVHVSDPDPNECIAKAKEVMRDRLSIDWKDVLHVSISAIRPRDEIAREVTEEDRINNRTRQHGFILEWERKQVGERSGEPCWRENPEQGGSHHIWNCELKEGLDNSYRGFENRVALYAVVDDTLENRKALDRIGTMLDNLRAAFDEFLGPEKIRETLLAAIEPRARIAWAGFGEEHIDREPVTVNQNITTPNPDDFRRKTRQLRKVRRRKKK